MDWQPTALGAASSRMLRARRGCMDSSNRIATLWILSVSLSLLTGVPAANAQADSPDQGHWSTCIVIRENPVNRSGPNFTVRVSFREQPIFGVKVVLTGLVADLNQVTGRVVATGDTDSNGTAHFFAIPPGTYHAHVDQALEAPSRQIRVEADNTTSDEVWIEWPSAPLVTRNIRGWITSWQKSSPQNHAELLPHKNVLVQLLDLRSGKPLANIRTDPQGFYEFPAYRDGLYVMRVGEHEDPSINSYDKAIEVSMDAGREHMPDMEVDRVCGNGLVEVQDETDQEKAAAAQIAASNTLLSPK